jgi:hypothetical protein
MSLGLLPARLKICLHLGPGEENQEPGLAGMNSKAPNTTNPIAASAFVQGVTQPIPRIVSEQSTLTFAGRSPGMIGGILLCDRFDVLGLYPFRPALRRPAAPDGAAAVIAVQKVYV